MLFRKFILIFLAVFIIFLSDLPAQKVLDRLKVTTSKRPTQLQITSDQLNQFCKYNQIETIKFGKMKIVIVDETYYLITDELNKNEIWAFELEQNGKKLYLNKELPIHSCSEGNLFLSSYLQKEGKLIGCKYGNHKLVKID